jgi:hypothetical protein
MAASSGEISGLARAESVGPRIRLREHFEYSRIVWGDVGISRDYFGATNTANLWWEVPGHWAAGLAFNPVLSSGYGQFGEEDFLVDDRAKLLMFGVEGKWHFLRTTGDGSFAGVFARVGMFAGMLLVGDRFGGDRWGGGYYLSVGWEFELFGGAIAIAPDLGIRHTILERDTQILSFTPSISLSFYGVTDWLFGTGAGPEEEGRG